jgi:hypothetical protein
MFKMLIKLLNKRIMALSTNLIPEYQFGFRRGQLMLHGESAEQYEGNSET